MLVGVPKEIKNNEFRVGLTGTNALQMAVGTGARVIVLDKNIERLHQLDLAFGNRITTLYSTTQAIKESVLAADLVVGACSCLAPPRRNWSRAR